MRCPLLVSGCVGSATAGWQSVKYIVWTTGIVVLPILGAGCHANNNGQSGERSLIDKPVIHGTVEEASPKYITKQPDNGPPSQSGKITAPSPAKTVELQPFHKQASPSVHTTLPLLSKSIVTEALLGNSSKPLSGVEGTFAGVLSNAASSSRIPTAESLLPSLPLSLADGAVQGSISPGSTALQYHDNKTIGSFGLGAGYIKPQNGSSQFGPHFDAATMLFKNVAVGSAVTLYDNRKDFVASTIWQIPGSGLRFKATGGYLSGNQNFDFPSGTANIDMRQYSYLISTQYIVPKAESGTILHSVGFSLWGAQMHQQSTADAPRSYIVETSSDFIVMNDPLKLSEGRLMGASADAQVAVRSNVVVKGSIGYEQLRFPFADGTRDLNRSAYYNADLTYEPIRQIALGAGYKAGAGENRITISVQSAGLQFSAFKTNGQNGVADDKGFTLFWQASLPSAKQQTSLASRMQPNRSSDNSTMLADAIARPVQLPQSFLTKVDSTAVTQVAKISKAVPLPAGTTVNTEGDVFVTVGTGAPTVTGVTRNGVAYSNAALFTTTATQVVVHTRLFPAGTATYVISVTNDATYFVTVQYQGN